MLLEPLDDEFIMSLGIFRNDTTSGRLDVGSPFKYDSMSLKEKKNIYNIFIFD